MNISICCQSCGSKLHVSWVQFIDDIRGYAEPCPTCAKLRATREFIETLDETMPVEVQP